MVECKGIGFRYWNRLDAILSFAHRRVITPLRFTAYLRVALRLGGVMHLGVTANVADPVLNAMALSFVIGIDSRLFGRSHPDA